MISNGSIQDFLPNIPLYAARPSFHHTYTTPYLAPSLATAKYYVRRDAVLAPGDKTFVLDIGCKAQRESVDRLKPARSVSSVTK